jgi:hypothetical protein
MSEKLLHCTMVPTAYIKEYSKIIKQTDILNIYKIYCSYKLI